MASKYFILIRPSNPSLENGGGLIYSFLIPSILEIIWNISLPQFPHKLTLIAASVPHELIQPDILYTQSTALHTHSV